MNEKSFEETKQFASDNLEAMHQNFDKLQQSYKESVDNGNMEKAEKIKEQLDSFEMDIGFEEEMFSQTFY